MDKILEGKAEPYRTNNISQMMLVGGIYTNTMFNTSTSHIAELMIQGSNRGITDMCKALNHHERAENVSLEIAKELMDTGHSVVYLTAFQLFELLSKAVFGDPRGQAYEQQAYPYIFDCDLLIIDDLGTELSNSFTISQFFLCINERILRRKSTLISSNLDMEALKNTYSERTLSRIISSYTIRQLPGSDIRIRKKLQSSA